MAIYKCAKCKKVVKTLSGRCDCSKKFIIAASVLLIASLIFLIFDPLYGGLLSVLSVFLLVAAFNCGNSSLKDRIMIAEVDTPTPVYHQPDTHHIISTQQINVPVETTTVNNNYNQSKNINISGGQIGNNAVIALDYNDNKSNFNNNNYAQNISGNNGGPAIFAPNNTGNFTYAQNQPQVQEQNQYRQPPPQQQQWQQPQQQPNFNYPAPPQNYAYTDERIAAKSANYNNVKPPV